MMAQRECHLGRAAFAGFASAYVMALAGYWLEAVLGIGQIDIAHAGLRYVSGGRSGWWVVGIVFHLIDGVLLGMLFGAVVYPRFAVPFRKTYGRFWSHVAAAWVFAGLVWLFLDMLIAMPFMGAGVFGRRTGSIRPALGTLALHGVFGTLLGAIYGLRKC